MFPVTLSVVNVRRLAFCGCAQSPRRGSVFVMFSSAPAGVALCDRVLSCLYSVALSQSTLLFYVWSVEI